MKLVDTDILIDSLRGHEAASAFLERFAEEIEISVLTRSSSWGNAVGGTHAVRGLASRLPDCGRRRHQWL